MNWQPVTLRPYDPNPAPNDDIIVFELTDREREIAQEAKQAIEDNRIRLNALDARRGGE